MQVDISDAPREPAKLEDTEPRPTTEVEDLQRRIHGDVDAAQTRFQGHISGGLSDTSSRRQIQDGHRPELGRAGTSLSEGQSPYAAIRAMTAVDSDSVDIAAPGGKIHDMDLELPPSYGPEARPTVSTYALLIAGTFFFQHPFLSC